jgi:heptosyltransferase-2
VTGGRDTPPVLLARGLNWLGDAVISLPALLAARRGWDGEIVTVARGAGAALYRLFPAAGAVLEDRRGVVNRLRLASGLRRMRPAKAVLWQNAFGAALTALLAGAPERVGYSRHGRRLLLTLPVEPAPEDLAAHEVFYHLKLAAEAGLEAPFSFPRLDLQAGRGKGGEPHGEGGAAGGLAGAGGLADEGVPPLPEGFLVALAPGASFGGAKRWPAARFAATARLVLEGRRGGAVILGGPGELEAARETTERLEGGPPFLNLAGRTGLADCARILARADLAVTNDSGLMHLACALGTPTVTPFGPTSPVTTGPLGARSAVLRSPAPCSPCLRRECPLKERICFASATPRAAAEGAERLLTVPAGPSGTAGATGVFAASLPPEGFRSPEGLPIVFVLPERASGDTRLGPPAAARPLRLPGSGPAPGPGSSRGPGPSALEPGPSGSLAARAGAAFGAPPAPRASFRGRPVYFLEDGQDFMGYADIALSLGLDPARSVWLASEADPLTPARALGGRACLWLGKGRGLPDGLLAREFLPDICAPGFQRALDWAEAVT